MSKYEEIAQGYEQLAETSEPGFSTAAQGLAYKVEAFRWRLSEERDATHKAEIEASIASHKSCIEANNDVIKHRAELMVELRRQNAAFESIATALHKLAGKGE